ncbi:MAG: siderophore-interacting protein [Acidimicrobiales bacterium]
MPPPTPDPPRPKRRRFRPVEVVAVEPATARLVRVSLAGESLEGFEIEAPTQHVKLLFPAPGRSAPVLPEFGPEGITFPDGAARPVMRTFTPRRFHPETRTLDVEFVLHDEGPASTWARQAAPGQHLAVAGPGGRMPLDLGPGHWVVAGDESAIPAVGTLLGALPAQATAQVLLEVESPADEMAIDSAATVTTTWLSRRSGVFGEELLAALAAADVAAATGVWVAGEATAVRRIRRLLLTDRGLEPTAIVTRGYWRLGEENHPDHDHGEDAA